MFFVDCNKCKHLNLDEYAQNLIKKESGQIRGHECTKHKQRVRHLGKHPKLTPCPKCGGNDFEGVEGYVHP